jgi:hypothetical protein
MSGVVTVSRALTPRNWTSTSDPTNAFDAGDGVLVGDHWYNTASGNIFVCVSNTVGAARWRHIPRILGQSGTAIAHTGTTAQTALATVVVPAGCMGIGGRLRVTTIAQYTNSANLKTFNVYFGAASAGTGGTIYVGTTFTTSGGFKDQREIYNRGTVSSQVGVANGFMTAAGFGTHAGLSATSSVNTANAAEVHFTTTLASSGETFTLESYSVELLRPDIT